MMEITKSMIYSWRTHDGHRESVNIFNFYCLTKWNQWKFSLILHHLHM